MECGEVCILRCCNDLLAIFGIRKRKNNEKNQQNYLHQKLMLIFGLRFLSVAACFDPTKSKEAEVRSLDGQDRTILMQLTAWIPNLYS